MDDRKPKCKGVRKNGEPCANYPMRDSQYCHWHQPSLGELDERTAKSISRQEMVALLAKWWKIGAAVLTGALADQVVGDLYKYAKKQLGMESLVPPVARESKEAKSNKPTSGVLRITNRGNLIATVMLSFYPRGTSGTYDFTYTIPPGDSIVVYLSQLAGLPGGKFSSVVSSDQPVDVNYVLGLSLMPEVFDPRSSPDLRWKIADVDVFDAVPKPIAATVTLIGEQSRVSDAGVPIPCNLSGNNILVDRSFILDYLEDKLLLTSGLLLVQMNGHLIFSSSTHRRAAAETPSYPSPRWPTSSFETTWGVVRVRVVPAS